MHKTRMYDKDTWSLDYSLAKLILPRLKRFKELGANWTPSEMSREEWDAVIDKMIVSFEWAGSETRWDEEMPSNIQEGIDLFAKYYFSLWW